MLMQVTGITRGSNPFTIDKNERMIVLRFDHRQQVSTPVVHARVFLWMTTYIKGHGPDPQSLMPFAQQRVDYFFLLYIGDEDDEVFRHPRTPAA